MSVLQTIDLKKYYGTKPNITRALDGVNFSVNDGEFVAVVGTSGSGGVSFIIREPPVYVDKRGLMFDNIELQWQGYPAAA